MEGINPETYLAALQQKAQQKGTPRTPREEQLTRAAELLKWPIPKILGKTRHFPRNTEIYTNWLKSMNPRSRGLNVPAVFLG